MSLRRDDPILFQVLQNAFTSVAEEMTILIQNVAFSLVVSDGRDASSSICDASGDLVASGAHDIPAHIGTHPFSVKGAIAWSGREAADYFKPNDIVVMNDAYVGGTHNNDVRLIMPVYVDGELIAFVANSAHWPDIGGSVPGTFDPNARSSQGEGLIIPPCHLARDGELDQELIRFILRNVRVADTAYGDLLAQVGAVKLGERRMRDLAAEYGADLIRSAMRETIEYSEALMRDQFAQLPDGSWDAESFVDGDPADADAGPVGVRMTLTVAGDRATYDLSGCDPQAKGAINGPVACTYSAAIATTKCIFPHVPMNQGVLNAIDFELPDGPSVVTAEYPAPISGMAATVFPHVANCVLKTFIQVIPERCMAGPTGLINICWGGQDTREGRNDEYVCYLWLEGGWGGRVAKRDNTTAMTVFATGARNQPIELHERSAPLLFDCYRLEPDTGGAGASRGSNGVTRRWTITHGSAVLSCLGDGAHEGPWGFDGGRSAPPNHFHYRAGASDRLDIGMVTTGLRIEAGHMLEYHQSGGGGVGDPFERDPDWVLEDVIEGYVTQEGARRDYGVVVVERGPAGYELDWTRTAEVRAAAKELVGDV